MRHHLLAALALLCCLAFSQPASAQYGGMGGVNPPNYRPGSRPTLSPYLNLIRNQGNQFNSPAIAADYYLGTRVEQQRRYNAQEFRTRLGDLELREQIVQTGTAPLRGGYFNNTMGFFNNTGGGTTRPRR